jgi:hypothetical protein
MHIECVMTMVVSHTQAILCAEAGLARISPPVSAVRCIIRLLLYHHSVILLGID